MPSTAINIDLMRNIPPNGPLSQDNITDLVTRAALASNQGDSDALKIISERLSAAAAIHSEARRQLLDFVFEGIVENDGGFNYAEVEAFHLICNGVVPEG